MSGRHLIAKRFPFDICHSVNGVPEQGGPGRLHGHTFTAEVQITSEKLTETGFVTDFLDLKPFGKYIDDALDHRNLNAVFFEPTREYLQEHLESWFRAEVEPGIPGRLVAVRLFDPVPSPVGTRFAFRAAHRLNGLAPGHKCGRQHGHFYAVTVAALGDRAPTPSPLEPFAAYVASTLDHQDLNEVLDFQPTSELLAEHFATWLSGEPGVAGQQWRVRVSETWSTWAEYETAGAAV